MKRGREEDMDIVWQTPSNVPERRDYIFRNGIRYVRPYYFEFICHVKNRWAGKTIVDLFAEEFKGRPYDYYVSAVKSGRIQVDGEMVPVSYIVQSSQKISHFLHRHEPPVMAWDVSILQKELDVLTVCKPASVPVHPCGQYRKNTVVGILQAEHDLAPLFRILPFFWSMLLVLIQLLIVISVLLRYHLSFPFSHNSLIHLFFSQFGVRLLIFVHQGKLHFSYFICHSLHTKMSAIHRLDRLVSGLLILARNASKADLFRQQIEAGMVQKQYVAKVVGVFPEYEQVVNVNVNYNAREGRSTVEVESAGNARTSMKGKAACTKFTRISTNGTHSIVLCEPVTGRTHQIRVHLQYTGHPIANDMLYLSEQVVDRSSKGMGADSAAGKSPHSLPAGPEEHGLALSEENSKEGFSIDPMCTNCPSLGPKGYGRDEEGLWLHCFRYTGPGWTYECPYPDWASLD